MKLQRLQPLKTDHYRKVNALLSGIHRTAARLFSEGWQTGMAQAWVYDTGENFGAFAIVYQNEFVVCYAAFQTSPQDLSTFDDIDLLLEKTLRQKQERPLFYNVRGDNETLITHLHSRGFKQDALGYEMVCNNISANKIPLLNLKRRAYDQRYFEEYISLLDMAFNPLIEQAGGLGNAFWREKENLKEKLAKLSAKDNFCPFWLDQKLVGLYYLTDDLIEVLAVHPDYQNKGYGKLLLRHATHRIIHQLQHPAAFLFVLTANQNAFRLYLRQGYKISGFYSENTYVGINC